MDYVGILKIQLNKYTQNHKNSTIFGPKKINNYIYFSWGIFFEFLFLKRRDLHQIYLLLFLFFAGSHAEHSSRSLL
jgi:hypothetical protein